MRSPFVDAGCGAALGYPGLILDAVGSDVNVYLFESEDLPEHWPRLYDFEGDGNKRVVTQVRTEIGVLDAWIYVLAE